MRRVGLLGGTFNPVHFGHLRVAQEIKEGFNLDRIYLVPASLPPHKETAGMADAEDRLKMVRMAVADCPDFTVSDIELKRPGFSYTIDTVKAFKPLCPEDTKMYLIMGLDAFLEIDTWKSYQELFLRIPFIVMAREGQWRNEGESQWKSLEDYLKFTISSNYKFCASRSCYVHHKKQPVFIFNVTRLDISSTTIRKLIKSGKSIKFLVPENVKDYIKAKGLYL